MKASILGRISGFWLSSLRLAGSAGDPDRTCCRGMPLQALNPKVQSRKPESVEAHPIEGACLSARGSRPKPDRLQRGQFER